LAANISKEFKEGDEIIVTQIDHQCNIQPWRSLARYGCVIKEVRLDPETQQLDFDDYMSKLSDKTKLVAVNWAANGIGTITDVKKFIDEAHKVGAFTVVDAVHYAAHLPIDVKAIDTDCLVCSPYKWFGPHMGLIYLKKEHLDRLEINNAGAPDIAEGARQFHMGTPQYEHLRGCEAAVNFIASVGEKYIEYFEEETKDLEGRRKYVVAGMLAIDAYEEPLGTKLRKGLRRIPGVNVYGPAEGQPRTPTVVFTMDNYSNEFVAKVLGSKAINCWNGDFYAIETMKALNLPDGVVRLGLAPYCTEGDIDRTLATIASIAAGEYDGYEPVID
ncbi:MAG: aminotransferase class V-fold PLP-dependent enzyme, partial [Firmicutes bacterium]|nr:aminotransferase class V-fold PLP-dependent enzyme [Bacillota bacterium]